MLVKRAAILLVLMGTLCLAQSSSRDGSAQSSTYVLLIKGIGRDPVDGAMKDQALNTLRGFLLERTRVDPSRLVVLDGQADATQPTADNIRRALDAFASRIQPRDRFIFYYLGQANVVGGVLRLNLPGPDITDKELADWLRALATKRQVVILDCPCAGLAAKMLTAEGRIIVCAATAAQTYATQFTAQLVQVLGRPATDADGDGKISLLEAFTATAREIETWYQQQQMVATETPCLEDNGDGVPSEQPWRYKMERDEGAHAAAFLLAEGH
jgi:hypothetical protein